MTEPGTTEGTGPADRRLTVFLVDDHAMFRAGVRAELGVHVEVSALIGADRVDAARVARPGLQHVVAALAVGAPDRVDGREVEDVEAEVAHVRQLPDDVVERAVPVGVAGL